MREKCTAFLGVSNLTHSAQNFPTSEPKHTTIFINRFGLTNLLIPSGFDVAMWELGNLDPLEPIMGMDGRERNLMQDKPYSSIPYNYHFLSALIFKNLDALTPGPF